MKVNKAYLLTISKGSLFGFLETKHVNLFDVNVLDQSVHGAFFEERVPRFPI